MAGQSDSRIAVFTASSVTVLPPQKLAFYSLAEILIFSFLVFELSLGHTVPSAAVSYYILLALS